MKKCLFFVLIAIFFASCYSGTKPVFNIINDTNDWILIEDIEHSSGIISLETQEKYLLTYSNKITDNWGKKGAFIMYQGQKYFESSYKGNSFLNLKNYVFTGTHGITTNPNVTIKDFDFKITEDYIFSLPKIE